MEATVAYETLDRICKGETVDIDPGIIRSFENRGLIETMSAQEYDSTEQNQSRLKRGKEWVRVCTRNNADYEESIENLSAKLDSRIHRFTSWPSTLKKEQEHLTMYQSMLADSQTVLKEKEAEVEELEQLKLVDTKGYIQGCGCYYKPLEEATELLKQMYNRRERLDDVSFEDLLKEIDGIYGLIDQRYDRFIEVFDHFKSKTNEYWENMIPFAFALYSQDGEPEFLWKRAAVITDYLVGNYGENDKWSRVAASTSSIYGNIDDLKEELILTHTQLTNSGAKDCPTLWIDASNIQKFKGKTPDIKLARYHEFGERLFGNSWKPYCEIPTKIRAKTRNQAKTLSNRYRSIIMQRSITASLASKWDNVGDAQSDWTNLEAKLIGKGLIKSPESSFAAMVLSGQLGNPSDKANRLVNTFSAMTKSICNDRPKNYLAAATMSTLPGSIDENLELLAYTLLKFKKYKQFGENSLNLAAQLVVGGYRQAMISSDIPTSVQAPPPVAESSNDYDVGFGMVDAMEGALFLDLIVDVGLDLHADSLAGNLASGVIDSGSDVVGDGLDVIGDGLDAIGDVLDIF